MSLDNTSSLNDIVTTLNDITGISSKQSLINLVNEATASNEYYANQVYNSLIALGITPASKSWQDLKAGIDQISTYDTNLYNALVNKGVTPTSKSFNDIISSIGNIPLGKKFQTGTGWTGGDPYTDTSACISLQFIPSIIIISTYYNRDSTYYYSTSMKDLNTGIWKTSYTTTGIYCYPEPTSTTIHIQAANPGHSNAKWIAFE